MLSFCRAVLALVVGFTVVGQNASAQPSPRAEVLKAEIKSELRELHRAYLRRDRLTYRTSVFLIFSTLPALSNDELLSRSQALLEVGRTSADGLEPVLLAYADTVNGRQHEETTRAFQKLITVHGQHQRWLVRRPNRTFLVPLGREISQLTLDVRADAVRAMAEGLLAGGPLGLEDLLGTAAVGRQLCDLPKRRSSDRGANLTPDQIMADREVERECSRGGKPGKGKGMAAMGALAEGACMNPDFSQAGSRSTLADYQSRLNTLDACIDSLRGSQGPGAEVSDGGASILIGVGVTVVTGAAKKVIDHIIDGIQRLKELNKEYRAAVAEYSNRVDDVKAAAAEVAKTQEELDEKKNDLDNATRQNEQTPSAETAQAVADAQQAYDEAEEANKQAQEKLKTAENKADEAGKKAEAVAQDIAQELKGDSVEASTTQACNAAFWDSVPDHPEVKSAWRERLDALDPTRGPPDTVANWGPDSDHHIDPTGIPACGMDVTTARSLSCNSLVQCNEADAHCGCPASPSQDLRPAIYELKQQTCAATLQCPDGQNGELRGALCVCSSNQDDSTPPYPGGGPMPVRPTLTIIDQLMNVAPTATPRLGPLDAFLAQGIRRETRSMTPP